MVLSPCVRQAADLPDREWLPDGEALRALLGTADEAAASDKIVALATDARRALRVSPPDLPGLDALPRVAGVCSPRSRRSCACARRPRCDCGHERHACSCHGCNPRPCCQVFGDVHGQLRDVLLLFQLYGYPSHQPGDVESISYVFNGDWVDRGAHQLELVVLLLALKARAHTRKVLSREGAQQGSSRSSRRRSASPASPCIRLASRPPPPLRR
jgi:hypothetical protein